MRQQVTPPSQALRIAAAISLGWATTGFAAPPTTWGGRGAEIAFGLASDGHDRLFVASQFVGSLDLARAGGKGEITAANRGDVLVMGLDAGTMRWYRQWVASEQAEARDVAFGRSTIGVAGHFNGNLRLEPLTTLRSAGGTDAWVAALDPSGTPRWQVGFGGTGADVATSLVATSAGDLVVGGAFQQAVGFGDLNGKARRLISLGQSDAFVAALDSNGRVRWARSIGSKGDDRTLALAADANGGVIALLHVGGDVGLTVAGEYRRFTAHDGDEALLIALDANGQVQHALVLESDGPDGWNTLAMSHDGRVAIGGSFVGHPHIRFGEFARTLHSEGSSDLMIAVLSPDWARIDLHRLGGKAADTMHRVVADATDGFWLAAASAGDIDLGSVHLALQSPRAWVAQLDASARVSAAYRIDGDGITVPTALAAMPDGVAVLGVYETALQTNGKSTPSAGKTDLFLMTLPP